MMIEQAAVVPDQDIAVPDTTQTGFGTLVDADRNKHLMCTGTTGKLFDFRSRYADRRLRQPAKKIMILDRRAYCTPERKRRNERFGKCDQARPVRRSFLDQNAGFVDRSLGIEEHRRDMHRCGFEIWQFGGHVGNPDEMIESVVALEMSTARAAVERAPLCTRSWVEPGAAPAIHAVVLNSPHGTASRRPACPAPASTNRRSYAGIFDRS